MRGGERSARGFGSCPYLEGTLNNPAAAQLWGLSCVPQLAWWLWMKGRRRENPWSGNLTAEVETAKPELQVLCTQGKADSAVHKQCCLHYTESLKGTKATRCTLFSQKSLNCLLKTQLSWSTLIKQAVSDALKSFKDVYTSIIAHIPCKEYKPTRNCCGVSLTTGNREVSASSGQFLLNPGNHRPPLISCMLVLKLHIGKTC